MTDLVEINISELEGEALGIFSGKVLMGVVGVPCGEDLFGRALHVGDIVQIWHGTYIGTDLEQWLPSGGFTAMVHDSYNGGSSDGSMFPMGIKDAWASDCEDWKVVLVKKGSECVNGEHWREFGFNYRTVSVPRCLVEGE